MGGWQAWEDGGWDVCEDLIPTSSQPCVVYSIGIEHDTSFDEDFVRRYPWCTVYAFDPTIERKTGDDFSASVKFFNIGLGPNDVGLAKMTDGTIRDDPNFVGWSMMRLGTIMKMLGHEHVDVLKMDIEGSEWLTWKNDASTWFGS